jgi:CO dehydrogenase/acetyl-CoA synthase delta subunit
MHTQNVFWQVAGATSIGATADVKGVVLSKTSVDLLTQSSLNGRVLAQTAVSLDAVTVDSRTAA